MDSKPADFRIGGVASRAVVSRSTLYEAFESKSGLIRALLDDTLKRAGYERLVEFIMLPDPREAILQSLAYGCSMYVAEHAVLSRLSLLAEFDPDAAEFMVQSDRGRTESMRWMAERLHRSKQLKTGVGVEEAAALLWVLTSFATFDQLYSGWGMDASEGGELLTNIARSTLLRD